MPGRRSQPAAGQAAGEHRVSYASLFDEEIRPHNERFRAAAGVRPGDRVLDIGCGTGQSTREAARAAAGGAAVGVDLSLASLRLARRLSSEEGLRNVSYLAADAQVCRFAPASFDLCISRFGAMFFADPVAAFTNIRRALRPGARLVLLAWQGREHNEWSWAVRQALAPAAPPGAAAGGPDPFSLADPAAAERTLAAAGFTGAVFTGVDEPVYYGPDAGTACDLVLGLREPKDLLAGLDAAAAGEAVERLRAMIAAHARADGVFFGSRAWLITARLP